MGGRGLIASHCVKKLVFWPFGILKLGETDKGEKSDEADKAKKVEGPLRSDLFGGFGVLLVGILQVGRGQTHGTMAHT